MSVWLLGRPSIRRLAAAFVIPFLFPQQQSKIYVVPMLSLSLMCCWLQDRARASLQLELEPELLHIATLRKSLHVNCVKRKRGFVLFRLMARDTTSSPTTLPPADPNHNSYCVVPIVNALFCVAHPPWSATHPSLYAKLYQPSVFVSLDVTATHSPPPSPVC